MKKISLFFGLALIASIFAFYGCTKDEDGLREGEKVFFDVKIAGMVDENGKAVFNSANYLNLIFQDGDVIKVNGVSFTLRYVNGSWKAVGTASDMTNATRDTLLGDSFYCYYGQSPATASPQGTSTYGMVEFATGFSQDPDLLTMAKRGTSGIVLAGLREDSVLALYPAFAVIRIIDRTGIYNHIEVGFDANKVLKTGYVTPTSADDPTYAGYPRITDPSYLTEVKKRTSTNHGVSITTYYGDFLTANTNDLDGNFSGVDGNNDPCDYSYHVIVPLDRNMGTNIYVKCNVTYDGSTWTDYYKFENVAISRGVVYTLDLDW